MRLVAKRLFRRSVYLLAGVAMLELLAFFLCLAIERLDYRKFNRDSRPPSFATLAGRTGIFYQRQDTKSVYLRDSLLLYRFKPGIHFHNVEYPELHAENRLWVSWATGFVKNLSDPANPESIAKGSPVLIMTGGSTVAGDDISRNELTVPSRVEYWLQKRCEAETGSKGFVRVINAGVPGYTATQEITYFLFDLSYFQPLGWIQLTGINEPWHLGMTSGSTELHYNKVSRNYPLPDPQVRFDFFPATQKLFGNWLPLLFSTQTSFDLAWRQERPELVSSSASRFLRMIKGATGASEALGIPHFFFFQPTRATDSPKARDQLLADQPAKQLLPAAHCQTPEGFQTLRQSRSRRPPSVSASSIPHFVSAHVEPVRRHNIECRSAILATADSILRFARVRPVPRLLPKLQRLNRVNVIRAVEVSRDDVANCRCSVRVCCHGNQPIDSINRCL